MIIYCIKLMHQGLQCHIRISRIKGGGVKGEETGQRKGYGQIPTSWSQWDRGRFLHHGLNGTRADSYIMVSMA